jgi:hypothetical protein
MVQTEHIDPTALGLYLVAIVSLPLALSNLWTNGPETNLALYYPLLGLMIIACAYFAYKANSQFGFVVFALVGAAVLLSGTGIDAWADIGFGLAFLVAIIWSIKLGTPKFLTAICVTTALIFLIIGIMDPALAGSSDALRYLLGIVAIFNFLENFILATALATEGKLLPII